MATELSDDQSLKNLIKLAVVEVLEERKDLVRDAVEEALEDAALARAIDEGERSQTVSREQVFRALDENN